MKRGIETFIWLILLLCSSVLQAQRMPIKGTVADEKGPLAGVNVLIKSAHTGTQTDAKGNFSIEAAQDDTLVFSSVGYTLQEVKITGSAPLHILMVAESKAGKCCGHRLWNKEKRKSYRCSFYCHITGVAIAANNEYTGGHPGRGAWIDRSKIHWSTRIRGI
jgi:hypothetical protein